MTSWIIKTYHKKSIQEHEYWSNNEMDIIKKTLWRGGSWKVVTSDNNIPNWTFTTTPGGDDKKDSVDIYSYPGTDNVIDSDNSIVFEQAENRLHIQNAIMVKLCNKE